MAAQNDAQSIARTVLTTVTTIGGLLLIVFVEPPTRFWTAGDVVSGDWRPTIMAGILLAIYIAIMLVPGLRDFFELAALDARDWAVIAVTVAVWTLAVRFIWQARLFDRFLRMG
jgi:cation-transporting P-type ATPase E